MPHLETYLYAELARSNGSGDLESGRIVAIKNIFRYGKCVTMPEPLATITLLANPSQSELVSTSGGHT
tara:strand:+ start:1283 stop:1486 length:204 start_codon:yes stop_codon:yes gene_type:complete